MPIPDSQISLMFKNGATSVLMFIEATASRSDISSKLLSILHDRYPSGTLPPPPLEAEGGAVIPSPRNDSDGVEDRVEFAVLHNPDAPEQGWRELDVAPGASLVRTGKISDGATVAFRFVAAKRGKGKQADEGGWVVYFPQAYLDGGDGVYDDDEEEEE